MEASPTGLPCLAMQQVGAGEVGHDAVRGVEVEQVVEGRVAALELLGVGERAAAVRRLAVERGDLVRVLAVRQVALLAQDDGQLLREARRRRCG